jgi:hypothetical protein
MSETADNQAKLAKAMSEEQLVNHIIAASQSLGYLVAHFRPAKTEKGWRTAMQGDVGFPDLVMANGKVIIFAECKRWDPKAKVADEQERWLRMVDVTAGHGILGLVWVYVWRPTNWLDGTIERILMEGRER